jgi:soluble lytic murein transglycosylase
VPSRSLKLLTAAACVALLSGDFGTLDRAQAQPSSPVAYRTLLLSTQDAEALRAGLRAARSSDLEGARSYAQAISDPVAAKIVRFAAIDVAGERMSFLDLDTGRRDLWGWPRGARRQQLAEKSFNLGAYPAQQTIAWFNGAEPETPEGAMALANAYQAAGRQAEAQALIKRFWREQLFDAAQQQTMLSRFGGMLDNSDHLARLNMLLLGPQGPATTAMMALVPADQRQLAEARIALRRDAANATALASAVPAYLQGDPGLAYERARYYRRRNLDTLGFPLLSQLPPAPPHAEGQELMWVERREYMKAAMRARNWRAAYDAMNNHGFPRGEWRAESDFFAGWVALTRLNDSRAAARHFESLQGAGTTPVTLGRAAYWRGRAAEALGDRAAAQAFYQEGGKYIATFYGQLAAEKAGIKQINLGREPVPTAADRERFERRELVRAARMLAEIGEKDLFRAFVLHADDTLANGEEHALMVDLARGYGDQDLAMRTARAAAQRGYLLPERAYPLRTIPQVATTAEPAFVLAITRQESGFDPMVRSHANARGMMQLIPPTARAVARRLGVSYSDAQLWDPDYNMRLGAFHLGELIDQFSGSYIMAAAGYNAGPGRPPQWVSECGDPRGGTTDPLDFVECVPFTETRNYIMRVMENTHVYRARLNGGIAPLTPSADLKRGGYGGPRPYSTVAGGE